MHPTIKFMADWSKTLINFLDATVSIAESVIETDLYVQPTGSHQYYLSSFFHTFYSKKSIPYSQALRLHRICSNIDFFWQKMQWLREMPIRKGQELENGT